MKMHLRFDCYAQGLSKEPYTHPQVKMRDLGIEYQHATPQSLGDQWWFWNAEVPDGVELPGYIEALNLDPIKMIGYGLSKKEAEAIKAGEES